MVPFEIQTAEQLETAFAAFARERVDALLVPPDITFVAHHRRITELAASGFAAPTACVHPTRSVFPTFRKTLNFGVFQQYPTRARRGGQIASL